MGKKSIIYRGVKYTLNRGYYKTTHSLHRQVWLDHFGDIPADHHIHHKNGDPLDNRIENLECIHKAKHHSMHFSAQRQVERMHSKESRAKAKAWYRSEHGRSVMGAFSKKGWYERTPIKRVCVICSKQFETKNLTVTKYCSQRCRNISARRSRITEMSCEFCGQTYRAEKGGTRTCSRKCAANIAWRTKRRSPDDVVPTIK